jgi:hypothetical protein
MKKFFIYSTFVVLLLSFYGCDNSNSPYFKYGILPERNYRYSKIDFSIRPVIDKEGNLFIGFEESNELGIMCIGTNFDEKWRIENLGNSGLPPKLSILPNGNLFALNSAEYYILNPENGSILASGDLTQGKKRPNANIYQYFSVSKEGIIYIFLPPYQDKNNNYIDGSLFALSSEGNILWEKSYSDVGYMPSNPVIVNNIIYTLITTYTLDVNDSPYSTQIKLAGFDLAGNPILDKEILNINPAPAGPQYPNIKAVNSKGELIIAINEIIATQYDYYKDYYLKKYDLEGNELWSVSTKIDQSQPSAFTGWSEVFIDADDNVLFWDKERLNGTSQLYMRSISSTGSENWNNLEHPLRKCIRSYPIFCENGEYYFYYHGNGYSKIMTVESSTGEIREDSRRANSYFEAFGATFTSSEGKHYSLYIAPSDKVKSITRVDYNFQLDSTAAWSHPNGDQFGRRCK